MLNQQFLGSGRTTVCAKSRRLVPGPNGTASRGLLHHALAAQLAGVLKDDLSFAIVLAQEFKSLAGNLGVLDQ